MKKHQGLDFWPILATASLLIKISGSIPLRPVLTGPDKAYLNSRVAFRCIAPDSPPPVTYELLKDSDVLVGRDIDPIGGQSVAFFLKVSAASDGSYHCRATAGGNTGVSNSIQLSVVTYEGSRLVLSCDVQTGSHLSYTWLFNKKEVTSSALAFFHLAGNKLVMESVTPEHAGDYSCMAWSMVKDIRRFSGSQEVQVTIKVYVSKPRISFFIFKEGDSYRGNVTCWSSRGSPPVNFSLLVDDKEVGSITATDSLAAWFQVAVVPGLDMGVARCRVKSELQELISEPVNLEVVPVGGDVKVEVEHLYTAESKLAAARLSCHVSRGTFPYFSWLLNDTILPMSHEDSHIQTTLPHFALADQRRTLVLTKLSPEESGYYRCRARDQYDDSGPWVESAAELVQVTEVFLTTIEVITVAFCCFLLLALAAGSACVYKMFDHNQAHAHISPAKSEALPLSELTSGKLTDKSSTDCDVLN
ncbi:carcinoembryonic antigen-related cell adhesion molecule 5-like isoform X2 [Amphiprion ocellaris]|uniref:carcinoembryonic antigen-related cell adhesion molecule 5-like isoform X2 n=1 Tax=Amphiprion ocellaris TaxID=80972 RepID=UPI0024114A56|nr:carcinoembryonic antigen-related cell adhesion molecule 5-like isoform X2 [Amphiprion ocellaris]